MAPNPTQQRLEQAFAASGLTQAELARRSGIDRGSISLYLSGRYRPKADKLIRLAAALSVSPEWLSGVEEEAPTETALALPVVAGLDPAGQLAPSGKTLLIPRPLLRGARPEGFFVLRVEGLAMYPRLLEGDLLLVKKSAAAPEGATVVLEQQAKLLVRNVSGGMLLPANPEYPPRPLSEDTRILGRAVALIRGLSGEQVI